MNIAARPSQKTIGRAAMNWKIQILVRRITEREGVCVGGSIVRAVGERLGVQVDKGLLALEVDEISIV